MDEPVREVAFDDYFDALPVVEGILVRMSDNVAATLAHHVGELIQFLEHDEVPPKRTGFLRRRLSAEDVLRRMFPDAYRDRATADDFRTRHASLLRDSTAPRRVRAQCLGGRSFLLDHQDMDDWMIALGLVRLMLHPRHGVDRSMTNVWFWHMQDSLVLASNPHMVDNMADLVHSAFGGHLHSGRRPPKR